MSRQDQYSLTLSCDGTPLGTWDKMSGGEITSAETKYKAGGMVPEISLGGSVSVSNVTLNRLYRLDRDLPLLPFLKSRVGKGELTLAKQSLDVDGNPFGTPLIYRGKFMTLTPPPADSTSNAAAEIAIVMSAATVG